METGDRQPVPLHELLGIIVAPEFECSIAAAELNAAVADVFERKPARPFRALVDLSRDRAATFEVAETSWFSGSVDGLNYRLVLAKESKWSPPVVPEQTSGFKLMLRKLLSNSVQAPELPTPTEQPAQPPMLAALIEGSYLVPLATFEKRQDGACSYVQIGSEIQDDKLHAVRTDDAVTSRKEIIEDIRNFNTGSNQIHGTTIEFAAATPGKFNENIPKNLLDLVAAETPKYAEVLHNRLEQKATEVIEKEFDYPCHQATLVAVEPGKEPQEQPYTVRPLSVPIVGEDKRLYTFVLAKEGQEGKQTIGVIVRGRVYLPLVHIQPDLSHFESAHTNKRLTPRQLQELIHFVGAAPKHPANEIANADHEHTVMLWSDALLGKTTMEQIRQIQLNFQTRPATATRVRSQLVVPPSAPTIGWPLIKPSDPSANLAQFIADLSGPLTDDGEEINRLPEHASREQRGRFNAIVSSMRVNFGEQTVLGNRLLRIFAPNIDDVLPQSSHERIIDFLGLVDCTQPLVGELTGVDIGTVKGDLTIRAEFQRNMERYTCTIYGAPKALGTAPVRLYELSVNPLTGEVSDPERAADVLNLLTTLRPEAAE